MSDETYYELYGEYVSLKDLGVSTLISTAAAMVFYFLTPHIAPIIRVPAPGLSITLGAVGAAVGFAVSMLLVKVKRVVSEV